MSEEKFEQMGRLALRQEGGNWNAYYALPYTMDDAIFLGSIRMNLVMANKERKRAFMDLMQESVADIVENQFGVRPSWGGETTAPEHEKAGNA